MDNFARADVDYAQIELLLQQHKYDEVLPMLSGLLEKDPSDRKVRLIRLLVMRILVLRHLLGVQRIGLAAQAAAIASRLIIRTSACLALRRPSGLRIIPRLRDSIGAFLARIGKHRTAGAVAVPLALVVLVSVYVLVAWHVENRPRVPARGATPDSASRAAVAAAKPQAPDENSGKPLIVASTNSALDQSSFHRVLTKDLDRPLLDLGNSALLSTAGQNIAPRATAKSEADDKEAAKLAKVNNNHVVPKPVAKRFDASALKRSSNGHKEHVADAPKKIIGHYETKQVIPIRKSARFGAPTIQKIAQGTPVDVLGVKNSWAEVTLKNDVNDNVTGFVRVEFLTPDAVGSL